MVKIPKILFVFYHAGMRLVYDGGLANAGNVALSLLLSLFPFMLLIATLGNIWGDPVLLEQVLELVFSHWPAGSAAPIADEVKIVLSQARGELFSFTTLVALVLATNGIESARDGLNRAYKRLESRSFMFRRLQGTLFVFVGAIGLMLTAFILIGTPFVWAFLTSRFEQLIYLNFTVSLIQYVTAFGILVIILFCFHYYLPCGRQKFHRVKWGVMITIAGFIGGSWLFGFYLRTFADYTALYAGLAGFMIAIVYLYYLSVLILFGAEFNAAYDDYMEERARNQIH